MKIFVFFLLAVAAQAAFPDKNLWPSKVTLNSDQIFEKKLANGFLKFTAKPGQEVDLVSLDSGGIVVRYHEIDKKIPLAATDFLERCESAQARIDAAIEAKRAAEAAENAKIAQIEAEKIEKQKAREEFEKKAPDLSFDPVTQKITKPKLMQAMIEKSFRDPDSFKLRDCLSAKVVTREEQLAWEVIFSYGARNGFGGYNKGMLRVVILGDSLTEFQILE